MVKTGLEDVAVTESSICFIDGELGILAYRGYDVRDLARKTTFEESAYLLWQGSLPNRAQLAGITDQLAVHRTLSSEILRLLESLPASSPPMSMLRTAVSALGIYDPRAERESTQTNLEMAIEITSQLASLVATFHRLSSGMTVLPPDPRLSHAGNFLWMLTGRLPGPVAEKAFDSCLVLHLDHEFNASTFAARVAASTLADIYSAISAAIGTLRGPLHGGANQQVMKMLEEIGSPERARPYVERVLAEHKRVMGFGHRVYKTEDPRAGELRTWAKCLGEEAGDTRWFEIATAIEEAMLEMKGLYCNVDFYSAPVYHLLGIPTDLFTPVFAVSRVVGWTAHVLEQYAHNRLIRPRAEYTGPTGLQVAPIGER